MPTSWLPDILSMRSPATSIDPSDGVSRPPIRLSSVVLPDPDGPINARKSPCGISRVTPCSTSMRSLPRKYTLWRSWILTRVCISAP